MYESDRRMDRSRIKKGRSRHGLETAPGSRTGRRADRKDQRRLSEGAVYEASPICGFGKSERFFGKKVAGFDRMEKSQYTV